MMINTIQQENQHRIKLRFRDDNNERVEETFECRPYFYLPINTKIGSSIIVKGRRISFVREDTKRRNLEGTPLVKYYYENPYDRYNIMQEIHKTERTYQGDVDAARLWCIDSGYEIPEYNLRKWYFDIETQVGGEHDGKITVLSIYDNYTQKATVMTWFAETVIHKEQEWLEVYKNETDMLYAFIRLMQEQDPDMIIGWYLLGFDIPKVISRMCELNINPTLMSPYGEIKNVSRRYAGGEPVGWNLKVENYHNSGQPIKGRLTFCLMDRFERLWTDSQMGTLPSLKLDDCSKLVLENDGKVVSSKFQDNEFYERAWLEDTDTYLEYARIDVKLCVDIDEKLNVSENQLALQRLIGCPFENTYHNSQMAGVYFMKKADWIPPTGLKGSKEKFEAAFVMDPDEEKTYGQHENVAIFDFKSLYPSMMASMNISWETKTSSGYPVWWETPKNLKPYDGKPNIYFSNEGEGVLPQAVKELMEMRDSYKKLRSQATTDEEYQKWDSAQMATKRVVNAFYGILAKDGYGWGDMDMAKSITASARRAMRMTAFYAQGLGYEVIYGHTDSVFIKVADVDDALELREKLNDYISKEVFREPVELEFEKFASKFFLSKKKNRYCGWLSWKDGAYLDEDKFFVMGFEMKKSNETPVAKEFQENLLRKVSLFEGKNEIVAYCNEWYSNIVQGKVNISRLVKRSRLRKPLDDYKMVAGGTAGILYYNQQGLGGRIAKGDSYYYYKMNNQDLNEKCYIWKGESKSAEYLAFRSVNEMNLSDTYKPDWEFIAEAEIIKKSALVFESMGWPLSLYKKDINQKSLEDWW
jgi:DNA polymerase elongation subunit (family B)